MSNLPPQQLPPWLQQQQGQQQPAVPPPPPQTAGMADPRQIAAQPRVAPMAPPPPPPTGGPQVAPWHQQGGASSSGPLDPGQQAFLQAMQRGGGLSPQAGQAQPMPPPAQPMAAQAPRPQPAAAPMSNPYMQQVAQAARAPQDPQPVPQNGGAPPVQARPGQPGQDVGRPIAGPGSQVDANGMILRRG